MSIFSPSSGVCAPGAGFSSSIFFESAFGGSALGFGLFRMRHRSCVTRAYVFHFVGVPVDRLAQHRHVALLVRGRQLLRELCVVAEGVLDGLHVVLLIVGGQMAVLLGLGLESGWGKKSNGTLKVTKFLNF